MKTVNSLIIEKAAIGRSASECPEGPFEQDDQWHRASLERGRQPKRRAESENIETRGGGCGDRTAVLLRQPRPPLGAEPLLVGPEFAILLAVPVAPAHRVPLAVSVSDRYIVRGNQVCASAIGEFWGLQLYC